MRTGLATGFSVLLILAGCGSDSGEQPPELQGEPKSNTDSSPTTEKAVTEDVDDAVRRLFDQLDKGQYGRQWDELHPLQQAFITRDRFQDCQRRNIGGIGVKVDRIIDRFEDTSTVPGTETSAPNTAVTLQITATPGGQKQTQKSTIHMFLVDGQWRHSVNGEVAEAYKAGRCR